MDNTKAYLAESALISTILVESSAFDDVVGLINACDFFDNDLKRYYETIAKLKQNDLNAPVDIISVSNAIPNVEGQSSNDEFVRLAELASNSRSAANAKSYAAIIKAESKKRRTLLFLTKALSKINASENDYLDFLYLNLREIEKDSLSEIKDYSYHLDEAILKLDIDSNSEKTLSGLSTGFVDIDYMINGLQESELIILAARPSVGKTMLMLNIAENIACYNQKLPVVIFSMEMSARQIVNRSIVRASRLKSDVIFNARITDDDWLKIGKSVDVLKQAKMFINDTSQVCVAQVRAHSRAVQNAHGLAAIFIDYIGLMEGEGENETIKLGNISRGLKALARDLNVPVFVLCQLNRNYEHRKDTTPMLSDIRQSGNIEQDADVVMFLSTPHASAVTKDLTIAKNRNGKTGQIKLLCYPEHFEFKDL